MLVDDESVMNRIDDNFVMIAKDELESNLEVSKVDFINMWNLSEIAEWVLFKHLVMFCRENGYAEWKRVEMKKIRERTLEEM